MFCLFPVGRHFSGTAPDRIADYKYTYYVHFSGIKEPTELLVTHRIVERIAGPQALNFGLLAAGMSSFESLTLIE